MSLPQVNLSTASIFSFAEKSNSKSYEPNQARSKEVPGKKEKRRQERVAQAIARDHVHPAKLMGATEHRREVERHIELQVAELQASELDEHTGHWIRASKTAQAKAFSHQSCGQFVDIRVCEACGSGRAGSGFPTSSKKLIRGEKKITLHCDMECCGFCGRNKADILANKTQDKIAVMPLTDNFVLAMLTFTEHSDPKNPAEYTIKRIWERLDNMKTGIKVLWDPKPYLGEEPPGRLKFGKPVVTGMMQRIEISENGALHTHALYYGPWRIKEQMEAILKRAWPDAGFMHVKKIATTRELKIYQASHGTPDNKLTEEERSINSAIREIAKYAVKSPSPLDEDHLGGGKRLMIDPALAAKYELATYRRKLIEWRGLLRGSPQEEAEAEVKAEEELQAELNTHRARQEQDDHIQCSCGSINKVKDTITGEVYSWVWATRPIKQWVQECHTKGQRALSRSRWEPTREEPPDSSRHGPPASA